MSDVQKYVHMNCMHFPLFLLMSDEKKDVQIWHKKFKIILSKKGTVVSAILTFLANILLLQHIFQITETDDIQRERKFNNSCL